MLQLLETGETYNEVYGMIGVCGRVDWWLWKGRFEEVSKCKHSKRCIVMSYSETTIHQKKKSMVESFQTLLKAHGACHGRALVIIDKQTSYQDRPCTSSSPNIFEQ